MAGRSLASRQLAGCEAHLGYLARYLGDGIRPEKEGFGRHYNDKKGQSAS